MLTLEYPAQSFASHWIRIAAIVIYLVLQSTPTHVNAGPGILQSLPSLFAATKYGSSWSVLGIWFFVPTIPCKRNNNARGNKHIIQMRKQKGSMSSEGCRKAFHTVWMLPCVVSQPNINQEVFVNYPKSFVKTWPLMHTLDTHIKIA